MPSAASAWVESLSPWPEEFGLGRMKALLARLGHPERQVQAIHVVGTNGKSTTTRMIEALLLAEGVLAGAYVSPHVVRWSERIRVGGEEADFERAIARIRPAPVSRVRSRNCSSTAARRSMACGTMNRP